MSTPAPSPVGRRSVEVRGRAAAPIDVVWPLVGEARRWKEWSFLTGSTLVGQGDPAPDGVGAVRHFTVLGIGSREEVLAWDPPHHLAYAVRRGFPVRNHRADVVLAGDGSGTAITWSTTFDEKIPGTGRVMVVVMRMLLGRFVSSLDRYAAARDRPGATPDRHSDT